MNILTYIILGVTLILLVFVLILSRNFSKVKKMFTQGNVCVTGLRGTGKDMLMSNIIASRKSPYISNMDYKCSKSVYIPLELGKLDVKNNYRNFLDENIVPYDYPYPERCDIYISDCGVYFPSQYTSQLDKMYSEFPIFQALSRHLGDCNFHINSQNLNRVWNKIREQSDLYIMCEDVKILGRFILQTVTVYENYDSCINRVRPYKHIKAPTMANQEVRAEYLARDEVALRSFEEKNGHIKRMLLFYKNKSNYDTRMFKKLLKGGKQ